MQFLTMKDGSIVNMANIIAIRKLSVLNHSPSPVISYRVVVDYSLHGKSFSTLSNDCADESEQDQLMAKFRRLIAEWEANNRRRAD